MAQNSDNQGNASFPKNELILTDPQIIRIVLHNQKLLILNQLFTEMRNIKQLKKITGLNPGTIKRHLDDLLVHQLVKIVSSQKTNYNITMKFYQAVAKKFMIIYQVPS